MSNETALNQARLRPGVVGTWVTGDFVGYPHVFESARSRSVLMPCLQHTRVVTLQRKARRGSSVDTWIFERTSIFEAGADHELPMATDEPDPTFTFNFKSSNRTLQQTLLQLHDRHRRNLNALWAARDHFQGMNAQYQDWKVSHKLPRFLSKMQTPPKAVGSRCPRNLDPRGKTLGELVAELDDQDVDQMMMQAKAAELDVLQQDVS